MDLTSYLILVGTLILIALTTCYFKFVTSNYYKVGIKLPSYNKCLSFDLVRRLSVDKDEIFSVLKEIFMKTPGLDKDVTAIWLGPVLLVELKNLDDIEQVLTSQELLKKSMQYTFTEQWLGSGLLTSTGELWHRRRKLITPTFHFKILEGFVDIFNSNLQVFISKLKDYAGKPTFDVAPMVQSMSLDIIGETAMSKQINAQKYGSPVASAIKGITEILVERVFKVQFYPDLIYNMSSLGAQQRECKTIIDKTIEDLIVEKKKDIDFGKSEEEEDDIGSRKKIAFLDQLLISEQKGLIDSKGIKDEVNTFLFEGHDTTTSATQFALYLLSKNQDIQQKVYEEISQVLDGKTSDLDHKDLGSLKYLERVIKEVLRLYPSVPMIGRTPTENFKLKSGHVIPPGAAIIIFLYHIHRFEETFPNPDKFDPDRFLPENSKKMHSFGYLPFSAGYRNCIGQKFAMLEMKAAISSVVRNFKILPSDLELNEVMHLILRSSTGINIRLEQR